MRVSVPEAQIGLYAASERVGSMPQFPHYTFKVGQLRDPIGHAPFKGLDGRDPEVRKWIQEDKRVKAIIDQVRMLAHDHIKTAQQKWLSICFRDIHGKWISAALAEIVADALEEYKVCPIHSWNQSPHS